VVANDDSQYYSSASTTLDEAAASFDVASWQIRPSSSQGDRTVLSESSGLRGHGDDLSARELDSWAQTPSTWQKDPSIEFRVRCEGQPTRRLRLAGARYTLGSGVGCSIRLEDASLRSLHAVLMRDHERILVRAYSVPFQINNVRTNEGILHVGDRLRLGSYEFELLENSPRPFDAVSQAVAHGLVGWDGSNESRGASNNEDWSHSFHEEAKQWRALKQDVERRDAWCKTRERELTEQTQTLEQQLQTLRDREEELHTQESAAIEVHEEFQRRYNDLLQHRDELQLQQEELAAGREHLRMQQERLDGRDRLHRQQIEKLLNEQQRYKLQETISAQQLAESEEKLRASRMQAEAATKAVEQMREKFASLNEQLVELSYQQETLQRLEASRADEHHTRCRELEDARDDVATAKAISDAERERLADRCEQLETIEDQLRTEIEQLLSEISKTRFETETLDKECQLARKTINNLETTLRKNQDRFEADRESWTEEVETLRRNVENLSVDLAGAQAKLNQLREENERLSDQLTGATTERDEARAEREEAIRQCEEARQECDRAKMDCESARRELETARLDVQHARQERDDAAALRNELASKYDELLLQQGSTAEQKLHADRRYQEALTHLADARQKCEQAVRARDEAEAARMAAEEKWTAAVKELQAMQAERDSAIADQDDLRRQRDQARQDAKETRKLFDRSNRDHDDTLDRIEHLEQKTREVIGSSSSTPLRTSVPKLGLLLQEDESQQVENPSERPESRVSDFTDADADLSEENASSLIEERSELTNLGNATDTPAVQWSDEPESKIQLMDDEDVWPTYASTPVAADQHERQQQADLAPPVLVSHDAFVEQVSDFDPQSDSSIDDELIGDIELQNVPTNDESEAVSAWSIPHEELEPIAELPQWPEESQSYLSNEERSSENACGYADQNEEEISDRFDDERAIERNVLANFDSVEPVDSYENAYEHDSYSSSVTPDSYQDYQYESPSLQSDAINEPVADHFDDQHSYDERSSYDDNLKPWQSEDEPESESSDAPAGSLAERLLRDLGLDQKSSTGHSAIESDSDDLGDSSATAMWNGGRDFQAGAVPAGIASLPYDDEDDDHADNYESTMVSDSGSVMSMLGRSHEKYEEDTAPYRDQSFESDLLEPSEEEEDDFQSAAAVSVPPSNEPSGGEVEDDSIEAYMNRLLQRVQGQSTDSVVLAPAAKKSPAPLAKPAPVKDDSTTNVFNSDGTQTSTLNSEKDTAEIDPSAPLVPRSQAPERNSDLSAMRELANASARSAITRSQRSQSHTTRVQSMVKFAQAGVALLCGIAAVWLVALPMLKVIAAVASLLIAAICVKEGYSLLTELSERTISNRSNPEPAAEVEA
jgi:hypothetical protein